MNKRVILTLLVIVAALLVLVFSPFFKGDSEIKNKNQNVIEASSDTKIVKAPSRTIEEIKREEFDKEIQYLNKTYEDKEEWFKQYKLLIDDYSHVIEKPGTIYDAYTEEELDLLFRVVQAEIGHGYSFTQKANVVSVIFNRIESDKFGNSIGEVLIRSQFSTISNNSIYKVEIEEKTILACEYVYMFGDTTGGALFFDSNGKLNYKFLFNDGAHNLYTTNK